MNSSKINKLKYRECNNIEQVERGVNKKNTNNFEILIS